MTTVHDIPRAIVDAEIRLARFPFDTFSRFAAPSDPTVVWGPGLAADTIEAAVRQWAGNLLGADTLQRDAELLRVKVAKLRDAAEHKAAAEAKRQEAEQRFESRAAAAERQRQQAEKQAEEKERSLEMERAEEKRRVREEAAKREQAAAKADAERERKRKAAEATARLKTLESEQQALAARDAALRTEEEAVRLKSAAKGARAARKR